MTWQVKKKNILCLTLFMLVLMEVSGQNKQNKSVSITGQISDEADELLVGANVWLISKTDTLNKQGVATNERGVYSLDVSPGEYEIRVSYIGYTTYMAQVYAFQSLTLPNIALSAVAEQLETVTVIGKSIIYNISGYKAKINQNPFFKSHTMDKVVAMLPGVARSNTGMSLYNLPVAALYVNGRKIKVGIDEIEDYLRNLSGEDIQEVQVETGTGIGSGGAGYATLWVVTKKVENGGKLMIGYDATMGKYRRSFVNPRMNLDVNYGKLSVYGMASNFSFNNKAIPMSSKSYFLESNRHANSVIYDKGKMKRSMNCNLSLYYDFSKNECLMMDVQYQSIKRNSMGKTITEKSKNCEFEGIEQVNSGSIFGRDVGSFTLDYLHKWRGGSLQMTADYMCTKGDESQLMETSAKELQEKKNMLSNRTANLYSGIVRMQQKVGKWQGVLKVNGSFSYLDSEMYTDNKYADVHGILLKPGTFNDRYNYEEKVCGLYVNYSIVPLSGLSMSAGMRYEHIWTFPKSVVNPERNYSHTFDDFYPYFRFNYIFNRNKGHNVNFSYSRSAIRPDIHMLNPAIVWDNEYAYHTGNPYLNPARGNTYLAVFTLFGKYSLSATHIDSDFYQNAYRKDTEKDGYYSSYENGGKNNEWSFGFSAPFMFSQGIMLNPSINYFYNHRKFEETTLNQQSWNASFNAMCNLPLDITSSLFVVYNSPVKVINSRTGEFVMASLSFQKSFLKHRLSVDVGVDYLSPIDVRNYGTGFEFQSYGNKKDAFKATLRLNYNLNWGKRTKMRSMNNYDTEAKRLRE